MRIPENTAAPRRYTQRTCRWQVSVVLLFVVQLGFTGPAHAQAPAAKRTIIRPGRVLDVRSGELRSNQAILIETEKIVQIGAASEVKAATGDTTIDLPEATLLPGLIDAHTHLTFDLNSLGY